MNFAHLRRLGPLTALLKPHRNIFGITTLLGLLHQGGIIASAGLAAYLVGQVSQTTDLDLLRPLFWWIGSVVLITAITAWLEMWLAHDLAYRVLATIRNRVYETLERLAPAYLGRKRTGEVAATAMADVETLEWFYAHTLISGIVALVVTLTVLVVLAIVHPFLPLLLIPLLIAVAIVPTMLAGRAARQGAVLRGKLGELNAEVVDGLQGMRELSLFAAGPRMRRKLNNHGAALVGIQWAYGKRAGLEGAAVGGLTAFGMLITLLFSARTVADGAMAPDLFPVAVILAGAAFGPVAALSALAGQLGVITAAADRLFDIFGQTPQVTDAPDAVAPDDLAPELHFDQVHFRYPDTEQDVLHDLSFHVRKGETVVLAGHSGAGKSTCAQLCLRFYDVHTGAVRLGGHPLPTLTQACVRDAIAYVSQDIHLFNTSLRDNIRLGRPDATDAEVEQAAKDALIHDFITELPKGYDTRAGERGVQLSGGQRQRIAIARAFLKNAPILVMDEAVSNLDPDNERLLNQAMDRLHKDRTTLIIAHRLSTIRTADRIVLLENGRLVAEGDHEQLLADEPVYRTLIAAQLTESP